MAPGPNLWKVDFSFTAPAGATPSGTVTYSVYKRVMNGTTAQKKAIAEAAAVFDSTLIKNAAGASFVLVGSAERNDLL